MTKRYPTRTWHGQAVQPEPVAQVRAPAVRAVGLVWRALLMEVGTTAP